MKRHFIQLLRQLALTSKEKYYYAVKKYKHIDWFLGKKHIKIHCFLWKGNST